MFFFSDDDSDVEITDELTVDKESVLDFLNNALAIELLLLNQCTEKKLNAIIEARPFSGWRDLVFKLRSIKHLDTGLLNATQVHYSYLIIHVI